MHLSIRPEKEVDYEDITRVHSLAFNQTNEGELVKSLRKTSRFISNLSLVAKCGDTLVGHILFYPITINTGTQKCDALVLAPISVRPNFQNRGIGTTLIKKGLTVARHLHFRAVIVIGHSEYYPRFGFENASKWGITTIFGVPDDAFFALELTKNGLKNCQGTVEFPPEFNDCM